MSRAPRKLRKPRKKKPRMTEDVKARRRAARKAEAINARARAAAGPLFAPTLTAAELTTADDEYWKWRRMKAVEGGGGGEEAAYLWSVDRKVDLWLLRNLARRVLSPEDFAVADTHRWHGDDLYFWRNILLGRQRIVLSYWRHVHGCKTVRFEGRESIIEKRIDVGENLVWPPPGWKPPFTPEELEAHLALPAAAMPAGVIPLDSLNLAGALS